MVIKTRCACETQMPLIMTNSNDGQGHKDKYLETSRKILSQEMLMCNKKALALTVQKLLARLKFSKNGSNSKVKVTVSKIIVLTHRIYHREYSCEISKRLALADQKYLARLKNSKMGQTPRSRSPGKK